MKKIILITLLWVASASAHEEHHSHEGHHAHEELQGTAPVSGASVYQFESKWTDQNGNAINLSKLAGESSIVAMLYTRCQSACPLLVDDIQQVLKKLPEKQRGLRVVLFSFDSKLESPATMSDFIKKRKLGSNWTILKSDKSAVAEMAAALGVRYKELSNGEYIHSNSIFLLNEKGEVVGTKEGLKTSDKEFVELIKKTLKK